MLSLRGILVGQTLGGPSVRFVQIPAIALLPLFRDRCVASGRFRRSRHSRPRRTNLLGILQRHPRRLPSTGLRDCRQVNVELCEILRRCSSSSRAVRASCPRPAPASQRRDSDSPSGLRPLRHPVSKTAAVTRVLAVWLRAPLRRATPKSSPHTSSASAYPSTFPPASPTPYQY
jgi:hypothetical protein